ncbi:MAG: SagB/ThcOx family dehydrogenase [Thermodesulfovibrio sp.]|nr:SagB/ThcOx family dehydrogenase [Thermodesulfovibrio sp.]MDW7998882.1 SagB/ThcOx family dehydrogenase [Thermodesulfovibrio sp.]
MIKLVKKIGPFIIILFICFDLYAETLINLPKPRTKGNLSLEETLNKRRSLREYSSEALTLTEVSQLLWSSQGITDEKGRRTAPSAGALYPISVYLVAGNVKNISSGLYKYEPHNHQLIKIKEGDIRDFLSKASLGQPWVRNAPINLVITAVYEITTRKYGERGIRYVHIEVGHAAQNVLLQAVALDLGAVPVGAFNDEDVKKILNLKETEQPLYIIPVGRKK